MVAGVRDLQKSGVARGRIVVLLIKNMFFGVFLGNPISFLGHSDLFCTALTQISVPVALRVP
jgi:hypothetical protein